MTPFKSFGTMMHLEMKNTKYEYKDLELCTFMQLIRMGPSFKETSLEFLWIDFNTKSIYTSQ